MGDSVERVEKSKASPNENVVATQPEEEPNGEVEVLILEAFPDEATSVDARDDATRPVVGSLDDSDFYRREASALSQRQPERAALMYLEAAEAAERAGRDADYVLTDVQAALNLRSASNWLLPLARRMFIRQRRFGRALEIASHEVELGGANTTRAAILQEAASVVRYHKSDPKGALDLLESALAIQPGEIAALSATAALRGQLARLAQAAEALEQLSALLSEPEERSLYLYAAGTLRETRLDQPEKAEVDYQRAVEQDRQNLPAVMALNALYERHSKWSSLCGTLEHLANLTDEPTTKARMLYQTGSLHLDFTGDLEGAARDLRRATEAAPDEPSYLQRLAYVYEANGHYRDLVETLRKLLALTLDAEGRAAILTHIGSLLQSQISANDEAIAAYREALEQIEGYLPALQSLGTLFRQRGDYESLLEIYAPEVEGTLPESMRAVRCVEIAEILESQLDRPEDAIQHYQRALELDPSLFVAFWGLRRLLKRLEAHEALAELLAFQAKRSRDERTTNHLLSELARLQAGPLDDPDRAIATFETISNPDRTRTVAIDRIDLYERTERHVELVTFCLEQADDTDDPIEAQGRRLQAASALEFALDEYGQALDIYKQVLTTSPRCVAAIRGAGRIYHRLGRWADLVKLQYHELGTGLSRPDAPVLLFRIGRILEEHLGRTTEAIKAYSEALERDPAYVPALSALEHLVRAEQRWEDLVQVLHKYAAARSDNRASADALCRAAEVSNTQIGDLEKASALYREALSLCPDSDMANDGLLRVYRRMENWKSAVMVLDRLIESAESAEVRSQRQLDQARLKEHRLLEGIDYDLYLASASNSPYGKRLRVELTRALRVTASTDLATWLEKLGRETSDATLAAAYLLESAHLNELSKGASGDSVLGAVRLAHQRRPEALAALWSLERALSAAEIWAELGAVREREAKAEVDPAMRVVRLSNAAVAYLKANQPNEAERVSRQCLNFDAHSLSALKVLAEIAEKKGDWTILAGLYDRMAEACSHSENRLACCLKAADLWVERLDDSARALASLSVALTDDPGQPDAFDRAERLHRAHRQFDELSALYRWRVKACGDPNGRVELLRRHAHLLRDDLGEINLAIAELSALLTLKPTDVDALSEISELLVSQKHWADGASRLGVFIDNTTDPDARHRARLQQAELLLRHLHETKKTRGVLKAALDDRADDLSARRLLVELCTAEGNWKEARSLLEKLATIDDAEVQVWAMGKLAEVARLGLRDPALARRAQIGALERVADNPKTLPNLSEDFWRQGDLSWLVGQAEGILADRPAGGDHLRAVVARRLLEDLDKPANAIEHLRTCRAADPDNADIHLLLCQSLERLDELDAAVNEYRTLLQKSVGFVDAYSGLARAASQSGQTETAVAAASLVDLLGTASPKETTLLKGLTGTTSPPGVVEIGSLPFPESLQPFRQVLKEALPYLDAVYPTYTSNALSAEDATAVACQDLARTLGVGRVAVSLSDSGRTWAGVGDPVSLKLSTAIAESPGDAAYRFWVGRALYFAAAHSVLLVQLENEDLSKLFDALTNPRPASDDAKQLRRQLAKILPRKLRKQLDAIKLTPSTEQIAKFRAIEDQRADKVGLLICRDPRVAIPELADFDGVQQSELTSSTRLARLLRYAISADYAQRSRLLWH